MADDRTTPNTSDEAAPRGRFVVIENTPGYLPDADDPPTFDSLDEAAAYLREEAHRALAEMEGEVVVGESGYQSARPVLSIDRDAAGRPYSARLSDVANPHDLGRVWNVETTEPDPGPVNVPLSQEEAAAMFAAKDEARYMTMNEAAALQEQAEAEGWDDGLPGLEPVVLPAVGSTVWVHPLDDSAPWAAVLVGYLPDGRFQVRSAHPDATLTQTVTRVSVSR